MAATGTLHLDVGFIMMNHPRVRACHGVMSHLNSIVVAIRVIGACKCKTSNTFKFSELR